MLYITTNYDISFFEYKQCPCTRIHFCHQSKMGAPDKDKPYKDKQEFIYIYIYSNKYVTCSIFGSESSCDLGLCINKPYS